MSHSSAVLITVTGPDHPGITARLTGQLARAGAGLLDIEQVVVRGQLSLALLVSLRSPVADLKALADAGRELGVNVVASTVEGENGGNVQGLRYAVTVIGRGLGAEEMHRVASTLARHGGNIERIVRLSDEALTAVEVHLWLPSVDRAEPLKRDLLSLSMGQNFDLALQREGLFRRSKRMVVMDMDSTLIRIEVIDELARAYGVMEQVAKITERAMHGEMDYDQSLRERLALLKGMPVSVLENIAQNLPLTDGAETLIRVLKRLGYKTAVLSGGFSIAAAALKAKLHIDFAHSNVLEVKDGKLTGNVVGPIVNAARKAELLEQIAGAEGVSLDQTIAVGDGANDLLMLQKAGLGIAFRAKPKLREAADTSLSASGLDAILFLLGLSEREQKALAGATSSRAGSER